MKQTVVLYIDDDAEDVEIFLDAVSRLKRPTVCLTAKDGEDALQLLDRLPSDPDLIFLDINMPRMGGKECLKILKQRDRTRKIPVVIYSTTNNPGEIATYEQLGADFFLPKPSSFQILCRQLELIVDPQPNVTG